MAKDAYLNNHNTGIFFGQEGGWKNVEKILMWPMYLMMSMKFFS